MAPSQHADNKPLIVATSALAAAATAAGVYLAYNYASKSRSCRAVLKPYEDIMLLSKDRMVSLKDDFLKQVRNGLEGKKSSLVMLPTMVDVLPEGHETGEFFAVDLGGTNFRMLYVKLSDEHGEVEDYELTNAAIPEPLFTAPIQDLFDLLGRSLVEFVRTNRGIKEDDKLHVGFTFSFPVEQTAIDKGKILYMTKKFANKGAEGAEPARLLEEACAKEGCKVQVRALLNDTVGTLASGRYSDPNVNIGIILGTGTNGAYVEEIKNISKLKGQHDNENDNMIINTEWGGFMSDLLPMTADDYASDASGTNPGKCYFEKLISGMFMGEAVRRILLNLAENADLFDGYIPADLRTSWHLTTADVAKMDEDTSLRLSAVAAVLEESFGIPPSKVSYAARRQVKHACWLVANRSARLLAVAVVAIMEQTGRTNPVQATTISVDGGVFEHYLKYRKYLATALGWLIGSHNVPLVQFNQFRDSSSRGAAYLAAAVHHHGEAHIG